MEKLWAVILLFHVVSVLCDDSRYSGSPTPIYLDPTEPIWRRVDDLLPRMTLEEKIAQLHHPWNNDSSAALKPYVKTGVGWVRYPGNVQQRNAAQKSITESSRLNLPVAFSEECLHSAVAGGTVFPTPVQQGCTWNTTLIGSIASAIALEASAVGITIGLTPVLNMFTDPRFGRYSEGFSENPTLSAAYARAAVAGYQGDNGRGPMTYLDDKHIVSLAKHLAAYGDAAGGLNAGPSFVDEMSLRDVYLKPWRAFAKSGGRGAMTSHQSIARIPCHSNPWLVNTVFRQEFGFGNGSIVSDCNDIGVLVDYRVAANASHAAAKGLLGGVDIDSMCGGDFQKWSYDKLGQALSTGLINESVIDTAVEHILVTKFASHLFDKPLADENRTSELHTPEHQQLAQEAALQGLVMVKYTDGSIPIIPDQSKTSLIAIIGPNGGCKMLNASKVGQCDAQSNMVGPYTQISPSIPVPTVAEALMSKFNESTQITVKYSRGCEVSGNDESGIQPAVELASQADAIVLVVGDSLNTCGEWSDRDSLDLPGLQIQLINNVTAARKPSAKVYLLLINGRPTTFGSENALLDNMDVVLVAWRPGEQGGVAIVDVLVGDGEPSGRLAQGWPRNVGQVNAAASPWLQTVRGKWVANSKGSVDPDGRHYDSYVDGPSTPLFPFGFGLTFTTFSYSDLSVSVSESPMSIKVSVSVKNTGARDGTEVVQVYIQDPVTDWVPYWKRLIGFQKIFIKAGNTNEVVVTILEDDLAVYDNQMQLRVVPGEYIVRVGGSSITDTLITNIKL